MYVHTGRQAQEISQILKKAIGKGKEQISVRTLLFRTSYEKKAMELDKDDKGRMHTQLQLWKSCT